MKDTQAAESLANREQVEKSCLAVAVRDLFLLVAICFLLYFWKLGELPFYDRGEPREGLVIQAMYWTGNWILPRINGDYIPFKPPLFHWFGVIVALLAGRVDEWVTRFPSALFGMLGVLTTYYAGRRLWNRRAGLAAAVVLATTYAWQDAATLTQVDITLAFFISAALLLFYFVYQEERARTARSLALAVLLALATLAKGPLGVAVPSFAILCFLLLCRDLAFLKKLPLVRGTAIFLIVAGSWYGLAVMQGGISFLHRQILDETLRTGVGSYGHHQPVYYFAPVLFYNMLPWSFFFPALAVFLYKHRRRLAEEHLLYPLTWIIAVFVFFSIALGKRGIYILPLYPAVALLFGAWWSDMEKGIANGAKLTRWLGFVYAVSGVLALGMLSIYLTGKLGGLSRLLTHGNAEPAVTALADSSLTAGGVALLATCLFSLVGFLLTRKWSAVFVCLAVIALIQGFVVKEIYEPELASDRTMKPFVARMRQRVDSNSPLFFYRAFDYGTLFYARRNIPRYGANLGQVRHPLLLMWEEDFKRLSGSNKLVALDTSEGLGPAERHRLLLVQPQQDGLVIDPKGYRRFVPGDD